MERFLLVAVISVAATAVAVLVGRVRTGHAPDAVLRPGEPPDRVDRGDFVSGPGWVLVVFTAVGCASCSRTMAAAGNLAADHLTVLEVTRDDQADLHAKYGVEALPTLLFVDSGGWVRGSYLGSPSVQQLEATLAELSIG